MNTSVDWSSLERMEVEQVLVKDEDTSEEDEKMIRGDRMSPYCFTPFTLFDIVKWCLQENDQPMTVNAIYEWLVTNFPSTSSVSYQTKALHKLHKLTVNNGNYFYFRVDPLLILLKNKTEMYN